jgi:hypothetical protein
LKEECFLSHEYLFFLQSANALDNCDMLIFKLISEEYSDITMTLLSSCFIAIDGVQKYFTSEYDILFQTGVEYERRISFAYFFSWCAPALGARVVISGTEFRIDDMDRLRSGNRPLPEYGIQIIREFNLF